MAKPAVAALPTNGRRNQLLEEDRAVHDWYRFVLSFPAHLVRDYLTTFRIDNRHRVLDPFCGTGTTVVECKKLGIASAGIEANPMAYYASFVKANWRPDPGALLTHARRIARSSISKLASQGIQDELGTRPSADAFLNLRVLNAEQQRLLLTDSISPLPLHKALVLRDTIERCSASPLYHHERIALAKVLVESASNLHFGPEVGVGKKKADAAVVGPWLHAVQDMARDLRDLGNLSDIESVIHHGDARAVDEILEPKSIDAVITSPPYPNEKDYTRTTRLESVVLGLVSNKEEMRKLKQGLVRSNTRSVYVCDKDDEWVSDHAEIQRIAEEIEKRRLELGKTSGFERLYPRLTRLYFGGMARHFAGLRPALQPGARLAYVVGDQASYLRVMIRTGKILGEIAEKLGYEVVRRDLFRTRLSTTTREQLREEVLILRWPG